MSAKRIVVRLAKPYAGKPLSGEALEEVLGGRVGGIHDTLELRPLFSAKSLARLTKLGAQALALNEPGPAPPPPSPDEQTPEQQTPDQTSPDQAEPIPPVPQPKPAKPSFKPRDFTVYHELIVPNDSHDRDGIAKTLATLGGVAEASVLQVGPNPEVSGKDDAIRHQTYLLPAPDGVDASAAWDQGADGSGVTFVDCERGWNPNHLDLRDQPIHQPHGPGSPLRDNQGHGTSVVGIACGHDHGPGGNPADAGITGIAPNPASIILVPMAEDGSDVVDAITAALDQEPGAVVLLEVQVYLPRPFQRQLGPVEAYRPLFDAIETAVAAGVVVVLVGGNGSDGLAPAVNLDDVEVSTTRTTYRPFLRSQRDSGAIFVSASNPWPSLDRAPFAPYGERIDCFAAGGRVYAPDGGTYDYNATFSGTSSAAAIVAGAAVALQSHQSKQGLPWLNSIEIRQRLTAGGTASTTAEPIGVMPNLAAALASEVKADAFMRDYPGDTGHRHSGAASASPDIIVRHDDDPAPLEVSPDDLALSQPVTDGENHFVFVRAQNRGTQPLDGVTAKVYWAPLATFVPPSTWTLIGEASFPTIPPDRTKVLAPPIAWPDDQLPPEGDYALVAVLDHPDDPAPDHEAPGDWESFRALVREQNNVTLRSVATRTVSTERGDDAIEELSIPVPAPADACCARRCTSLFITIKARSGMAMGIDAELCVPRRIAEACRPRGGRYKPFGKRHALLPVGPDGLRLGPLMEPPGRTTELVLRIRKAQISRPLTVTAHHLDADGEEIGRLTWWLSRKPRG